MSSHNDLPAFPRPHSRDDFNEVVYHGSEGMTLLDYFAAKELAKTEGVSICDIPEAYERLADHCFRMARAMMVAREKA